MPSPFPCSPVVGECSWKKTQTEKKKKKNDKSFITSVENPNVKTYDCITRLESLKDELNLKAVNIKKKLGFKN